MMFRLCLYPQFGVLFWLLRLPSLSQSAILSEIKNEQKKTWPIPPIILKKLNQPWPIPPSFNQYEAHSNAKEAGLSSLSEPFRSWKPTPRAAQFAGSNAIHVYMTVCLYVYIYIIYNIYTHIR